MNAHRPILCPPPRAGRIYWGVLFFMLGFVALLLIVSRAYLMPALQVAADPAITPVERTGLAAYSWLLLILVLMILIIGLLLTIRVKGFFVRSREPTRTQYVDAWAEAGRRAKAPPAEDEQET
jgi:cytochrome b561